MSLYQLFLLLHIIGAIAWLGSGLSLAALGMRATPLSAQDKLDVIRINEWFGQKIFSWSGMLTLLAGFALVGIGSRTDLVDLWVMISLLVIAASMAVLVILLRPVQKQILGSTADGSPTIEKLYARYLHISYVDVLLLLFVVFLMVSKPDQLTSSLLIGTTLLILAVVLVWWSYRRKLSARKLL